MMDSYKHKDHEENHDELKIFSKENKKMPTESQRKPGECETIFNALKGFSNGSQFIHVESHPK